MDGASLNIENCFCLTLYILYLSESSRNSPQLSDHSSPFDSVSGTAINLGQQQRVMSGLAKSEARDYGPGLTKDSTVMRPALSASTSIERQQEEGTRIARFKLLLSLNTTDPFFLLKTPFFSLFY